MKIGMPTLVECNSIYENTKLCKNLGLDFVELNLDLPYCFPENCDIKKLKKEFDIDYTIHLSEKIDIGDLNSNLRKFYISEIERIVNFGVTKANIKKYNLHIDPGIHFSLPDKKIFIYEQYLEEYKNAVNNSCMKLSEIAKKYDVIILFENVKIESYTKYAVDIIAKYDNLFFTLDLGHNIRYGNIAKNLFFQYPEKIKHIHMHDYDGSKDHQQLGSGILNIENELSYAVQNNIDILIEVKREQELKDSVNTIKNFISATNK